MLTLADIDNMYPETHDGSVYSDLFKDAYGFRPRGILATFEDIADFKKNWDRAVADLEVEIKREQIEKSKNVMDFEKRITDIISMGAGNRATAIRWICDGEGVENADSQDGYEHLEYMLNIPYGYIAKSLATENI